MASPPAAMCLKADAAMGTKINIRNRWPHVGHSPRAADKEGLPGRDSGQELSVELRL